MIESAIKVLPEELINKIAAGEVVERPASVVKELVENSIDAGARQIVVEIQAAGKKLIRVADDGRGLSPAEIKLALQRHATSKISAAEDLFNIQTLGFRGEALPSIASVSQLTIEPNPAGRGLTVEVRDIFYNTPARKKFLKSNATETGHCGDVVAKYALAFPEIAFKFICDGKPLIASPGTGKLPDAILAIYGAELVKGLVEFEWRFAAGKISGYVSRPTLSRIDKSYEIFFVNRRHIRNFLLNRALDDAYRTLIPNNRYPVGIIRIEIDPGQVDVNVHPTKREVKFAKNQEVMDAVREGVRKALGNQNIRISEGENQYIRESEGAGWKPEMTEIFFPPAAQVAQSMVEFEVSSVLPLIPLYQLNETYIIATNGAELAIIDQHAAHERIVYDRLSNQQDEPSRQTLLLPETLDLPAPEAAALRENLAELNALGFEIEEFGGQSFILRAVPSFAIKSGPRQLVIDLAAEMTGAGQTAQAEIRRENLRKLVACHSAIKAGDKLSAPEIRQLIKDLYLTRNPLTCPHGRPTIIRLSKEQLDKQFGR